MERGERGKAGNDGGKAGWVGGFLTWGTFVIGILSVFLISPESTAMRDFLESLGPLAPLAFLFGEIVQVVIIPIPGQPLEVAGGWLLGMAGGSIIGTVGALAGSVIAFRIARRFGRPWVDRRISPGVRRRVFGRVQEGQRAEWIIFWLMMIPNFPRDPLCFVAGVSGMRTRSFLLIALLGRPVGLVPWVALGAEGATAGVVWQIAMIAIASGIWLAAKVHGWLNDPTRNPPEPEPEGEG